ncbi:PIG-L deacetylase family protein [Natrialba taiwanensis]|uniref:Putative LmbE-like protein n=1 Tax=Natrialba taiwanensis DSM 12281 TaxID=1230458 RepID=M0A2H6_9EURY|nr:PIG-L family deacetylase [Natrialba taiwanensis]ELY91543.1 putative LmbE-like protein [Natrialba taiwanensis DSM 12281]
MSVLAIVAHPDDADIFCGGTLAKHADRGDDVTIIHMTRGELGTADGTEEEIAAVREEEARQSGSELGASVEFLEFLDGRVTYSMENRLEIVETIREHDPELILTHFRDDMHPDHRITSRLVTDAYYMASLPLVETNSEPCDPSNVYCFGKPTSSFDPDTFVDVSEHVEQKIRAVEAHESQAAWLDEHGGIDGEFDDFVENVRARTRTLGQRAGVPFAEGFTSLHTTPVSYLE